MVSTRLRARFPGRIMAPQFGRTVLLEQSNSSNSPPVRCFTARKRAGITLESLSTRISPLRR